MLRCNPHHEGISKRCLFDPLVNSVRLTIVSLLASILLSVSGPVVARNVVIVSSGTSSVYQDVVDSFNRVFAAECASIASARCNNTTIYQVKLHDELTLSMPDRERIGQETLIITIGSHAANIINTADITAPVLHGLIPQNTYSQLQLEEKGTKASAIFLDQPLDRLLRLSGTLPIAELKLGILLGPETQHLQVDLENSASRAGLTTEFETIQSEAQIGAALQALLKKCNLILALPDPLIYNRANIVNILLTSYHHRVPIVGFSAAYVKAGALIGVYSTAEDIGRQLAEQAIGIITSEVMELPPPQPPKYYKVTVNRSVARSLGIQLPDDGDIEKSLEEDDGK